jgi:hypothetical protein
LAELYQPVISALLIRLKVCRDAMLGARFPMVAESITGVAT